MHFWGLGVERQHITDTIRAFEEANPDIKVEEVIIDSAAYQAKIIQTLPSDAAPDVFAWWAGIRTQRLVDFEMLSPLTSLWQEGKLDDIFSPVFKENATYQDDQWFIPWGVHGVVFFYSKAAFSKLGLTVPTTYQEFEALIEKAQAAGYEHPIATGHKALYRQEFPAEWLALGIGGVDLYKGLASFDISWGSSEGRKVLELWKKQIDDGWYFPDPRSRSWQEGLRLLVQDKCILYMQGSYAAAVLKNDLGWEPGEDFDVFMPPMVDPANPPALTGPTDVWVMSRNASHSEEARRLLKFLAGVDAQTIRARVAGGMAGNRLVPDSVYDPVVAKVKASLDKGAAFAPNYDMLTPQIGFQRVLREAMAEFFEKPDVDRFIYAAEQAKQEWIASGRAK
jgi:ABC-type glycerol-3-phosphate transport system substrate-binding protein